MPKFPRIKWGVVKFDCPVCEMNGENKEVAISWDGGGKGGWDDPPYPKSWSWFSGCKHLFNMDLLTAEQREQVEFSIWQAVEAERQGALEAWAEAAFDEKRELPRMKDEK